MEQFVALARTVKQFAREPYPHLAVNEVPEIPAGDFD
jgi:hypothetical protein